MLPARRCEQVKEDGERCGANPMRDSAYCFWHSPDTRQEAEEARRLGGLRRRRERTVAGAYEFEGLEAVIDIRRLLEIAVLDTLSLENSVARSRALAYLAQTALKCLEAGELEDRLALLEATVRSRDVSSAPEFDFDLDIDDEPGGQKGTHLMSFDKRIENMEGNLTPKEAVIYWMQEAHQCDSLLAYGRWLMDQPEDVYPLIRLPKQVVAAVRARNKGTPDLRLRDQFYRVQKDVLFLYHLHNQVNLQALQEEEALHLRMELLNERLRSLIYHCLLY